MVAAFNTAMRERWMDEITLDQIARAAGTTRQTVIRLFGGKEGLVTAFVDQFSLEVMERRVLPPQPTPDQVAAALFEDYEDIGDFVIRMLAQEDQHPVLSLWHDVGRATHRRWIADSFSTALPAEAAARDRVITQLIIAGDVYTWKLLRRDIKLSPEAACSVMASMFSKLLKVEDPNGL